MKRLRLLIKRHVNKENEETTYVFFDIPEQYRDIRRLLNHLLKESGFSYVQKSVWKKDVNVGSQLKEWIDKMNLSKWVFVLIAKDFE